MSSEIEEVDEEDMGSDKEGQCNDHQLSNNLKVRQSQTQVMTDSTRQSPDSLRVSQRTKVGSKKSAMKRKPLDAVENEERCEVESGGSEQKQWELPILHVDVKQGTSEALTRLSIYEGDDVN